MTRKEGEKNVTNDKSHHENCSSSVRDWNLHSPSQLRQFLQSINSAPKKSLSQNFLIDQNTTTRIVHLARPEEGEPILEIGPGPGALTQEVLSHFPSNPVIVIEKDRLLAQALQRFRKRNSLEIIEQDFFDVDLEGLLKHRQRWLVLSNLPYSVATRIIVRLLPLHNHIDRIICTMQKEVGQRLTAIPSTKTYGSLSVFAQTYAKVKMAHLIPPQCFYPAPNVDSSVVVMKLHPPTQALDPNAFLSFVQHGFQQRRKMLRNVLSHPHLETYLSEMGYGYTVRAENLTSQHWETLFRQIYS